jgi:hypothetical protein
VSFGTGCNFTAFEDLNLYVRELLVADIQLLNNLDSFPIEWSMRMTTSWVFSKICLTPAISLRVLTAETICIQLQLTIQLFIYSPTHCKVSPVFVDDILKPNQILPNTGTFEISQEIFSALACFHGVHFAELTRAVRDRSGD